MRALLLAVLALACASACSRPTPPGANDTPAARPAPSIPWQPHGLRVPNTKCELDVPAGFTRSASPMPDHIAELSRRTDGGFATIVIGERVEPNLDDAAAHVRAYWRSGPLSAPGAKIAFDEALQGGKTRGHALSMRSGVTDEVETVMLLAFEGAPLVEIVARHGEGDSEARDAALALGRSLRCR